MNKSFLSATANYDDFINLQSPVINNHVQKNNENILKKVFTFFQGDSNILLINGFAGVGKSQVAEHILSYLDTKTLILKYYCVESTKLEDVQLSFYTSVKKKLSIKDSAELEAIDSIQDKIEYMLSQTDMNVVPAFFNFDAVKDENRQDILNYIFSLTGNEKSKIIICARTFDTDLIPMEIKYVKVMVKALSKELFETYIREFGIKVTPAMLDQFYRLTRGYFYSACISSKIMVNQELSVNDFIVQYTNSGEKFDLFLAKTYYRLIVGTTKSAFNLFVKLHHGLNLKILQTIGSYPENIIKMLCDNFYIYRKGDLYYPSEFLEIQLQPLIGEEISPKRLASYYEKQLALPPEERDFIVSRETLQEEIAVLKGIELPPPDAVSSTPETSAQEQPEVQPNTNTKEDLSGKSVSELFEISKQYFKEYKYAETIDVLSKMLDEKDALKDSELLYYTYDLLAQTYTKLSKWKYALYYYDLLEQHYTEISDDENLQLVQYEIASIYYKSYKIIDAIKILKNLSMISKNPQIISGSNLLMGNIALSTSNKPLALQYYQAGLANADILSDTKIKMELYFKYAILSDENNDINNAVEYYQKCIAINDTSSKYKALAYSNLADLFYDNELFPEAKECFEKAYEADKINDNDYGMYYSLSKIIELTDKKEKDLLVKLAEEAKEHALKTDDYNALLLSIIKLGDVYYDYPEPEKALAEYLALYREGVEVIEEPNFSMIKSRIEDIRARLGKEKFEELVPDYE